MNRENLFHVLTDLALAVQGVSAYPENHPKVLQLLARLYDRVQTQARQLKGLNLGFFANHVVVDECPFVEMNATLGRLMERIRERGIEKIHIAEGITFGELKRFVGFLADGKRFPADQKWESIDYGKVEGAGSVDGVPMGLAPPSPTLLPAGTMEALRGILFSLASEAKSSSVDESRDIVSAIISGLRKEGAVIDHLVQLRGHDDYTVTHSLNVCVLVVAQAAHLGFPEPNVREVGLAALLHDIGKEVVPSGILNKPGMLDMDERERMKRHPIEGAKLLRKIDSGSEVPMIVAFEHHVKYDHTGYPKVQSSEPLHTASSMTQIADVYDALRSIRPYKQAVELDKTVSIMKQGRGTEFDPRLFDNFLGMITCQQRTAQEAQADNAVS